MNLEQYKLPDGLISDLVTEYHLSGKQNRHILGRKIANAQLEVVKPAIEEADAKWVAVLKKYKVTVDSPESLAVSVDVLIEEAKKEERERIYNDLSDFVKMLKSAPEMHGDIQSDIPKTRAFIKYWQALKEGK